MFYELKALLTEIFVEINYVHKTKYCSTMQCNSMNDDDICLIIWVINIVVFMMMMMMI